MKKQLLSLCALLLALSVTSTTVPAPATRSLPKPQKRYMEVTLPAFNAINSTGNLYVRIKAAGSIKGDAVIIPNRSKPNVVVRIRNHTLYISQPLKTQIRAKTPAVVLVRVYRLNRLNIYGDTSIVANNFRASNLKINANTNGYILLSGKVGLKQIVTKGSGNIDIRWVNSKNLSIYSTGGSDIQLAGVANKLTARVHGIGILDAQYLRTQNALIQTKGFAVAKILPIQSLRAFAYDNSNIYYYKQPQSLSRFSNQSGNILQMAWWR